MFSNFRDVIQLVLALMLLVLLPAWDYFQIQQLRKSARRKLPYYQRSVAVLWVLTGLACWAAGLREVFFSQCRPDDLPWLLGSTTARVIASAVLLVFFAAALLPGMRGTRSSKAHQAYVREYRRALAFFLPVTEEELRWFTYLVVSAGICEEVLFRGFLMPFLHHAPPHPGWTLALVVSSFCFGWNHLYQGVSGVFSTALAGFAFGLLFLLTGNLVLPMLMHAVVDLQIVLVLRPALRRRG